MRSCFAESLDLYSCQTRSVSQLGRFVTSFPSLRYLTIHSWDLPHLGFHRSCVLHSYSRCSLKLLDIHLTPNISTLLNYFTNARPFVANLQNLVLRWEWVENIGQHRLQLVEVESLFEYCQESLTSLSLYVNNTRQLDTYPKEIFHPSRSL